MKMQNISYNHNMSVIIVLRYNHNIPVSMESVESLESMDSLESMESMESMDSMESMESMESMDSMDPWTHVSMDLWIHGFCLNSAKTLLLSSEAMKNIDIRLPESSKVRLFCTENN